MNPHSDASVPNAVPQVSAMKSLPTEVMRKILKIHKNFKKYLKNFKNYAIIELLYFT